MSKLIRMAIGVLWVTWAHANPICDDQFLEMLKTRNSSMQQESEQTKDGLKPISGCYRIADAFLGLVKPLPSNCDVDPESGDLKAKIADIKAGYIEDTNKPFPTSMMDQYRKIRDYTDVSLHAKCEQHGNWLRTNKK